MEYNCGFTQDNKWFRYRAAAIIVENGCVLFAGNEKDDITSPRNRGNGGFLGFALVVFCQYVASIFAVIIFDHKYQPQKFCVT